MTDLYGRGTGTANNSPGQDNDSHHVIFGFDSASVNSHTIEVYDTSWMVYVYDIPAGVTVQIQQVFGPGAGDTYADFTPLPAAPMFLDENITAIPLCMEGRYRFVLSDAAALGTIRVIAHRTTLPHQEYTHFYTDIQRIRYDLALDARLAAVEAIVAVNDLVAYDPVTGQLTYTDNTAGITTIDISADQLLADDPGAGPAAGITTVQGQLDAINAQSALVGVPAYTPATGLFVYTDENGGPTTLDFGAPQLLAVDPGVGPAAGLTTVQTQLDALNAAANATVVDTLVDNGNGSFTHTSTNGTGVTFTETPNTVGAGASGVSLTSAGQSGHTLDVAVDIAALSAAVVAQIAATPADFRAIAAAIGGDVPATSSVWGGITANHLDWDGTQLCVDFNNDGNPNA